MKADTNISADARGLQLGPGLTQTTQQQGCQYTP